MKNEKIKWGILGLGKIAGKFARGLEHIDGSELYAVASRSISKAKEFAREFPEARPYGSYEEMLKDENIDVIYIATPHVFHLEHSLLSLKHDKAVLCEKPFALNTSQVEEMITMAKNKDLFLMEAMWTQFLPHFKFVKQVIESGKYGKIRNLKANFGFEAPVDYNKRLYNKALGGGSLLDIGIYPVFMALSLLGEPEKFQAKAEFSKTGIDQHCDIIFEYPGGTEAKLQSSIVKKTDTAAKIVLEKATITLNSRFHEPTSVTISTAEGEEIKEFETSGNGYNFEAEHVERMLREGRKESTEMTFEKSLSLIRHLDMIRNKIDLDY
ncbi:Gfo/Idh/MocA family protein [Salegentibacter chungangensis]|uniref:Gfo/Idh/MocA family protein n=1 Tax=Salegentibacter chungangensis TaxID=1335724 RepID=A0ABW3NQH8_9FLAO